MLDKDVERDFSVSGILFLLLGFFLYLKRPTGGGILKETPKYPKKI